MSSPSRRIAGVPLDAWELLDPALQQALIEGRLHPSELAELAGWLDADDEEPTTP